MSSCALKCQMESVTWHCRGLGANGQQRFGIPAAPLADGWGPLTPLLRYYMCFLIICLPHLPIWLISVCTHTLLITWMQMLSIRDYLFVAFHHRSSSWLLKSNMACSLACVCIQSVCHTAMKFQFLAHSFLNMFG